MPKPWQLNVLIAAEQALASRVWCAYLSSIRAKSLPGSAPQALGHAVARDHALLPSRDGRFVGRARRAWYCRCRSFWELSTLHQRRFPGLQESRDQKIHCRFQACSLSTIEVARNNAFWSLPQKVVEFLELPGASGDHSKLRPWPKSPSPSQIAVTARFVCARRRVKKAGNDERKGHTTELMNC